MLSSCCRSSFSSYYTHTFRSLETFISLELLVDLIHLFSLILQSQIAIRQFWFLHLLLLIILLLLLFPLLSSLQIQFRSRVEFLLALEPLEHQLFHLAFSVRSRPSHLNISSHHFINTSLRYQFSTVTLASIINVPKTLLLHRHRWFPPLLQNINQYVPSHTSIHCIPQPYNIFWCFDFLSIQLISYLTDQFHSWAVVSTRLNGAYDVFAASCGDGSPTKTRDLHAE